jgi:hypothetical protein
MSRALALLALAVCLAARPAAGAEYRLQVANLYRESFLHYFDGSIGTGSGELVMGRLEKALDDGSIERGALLSDRTFRYGWETLAQSFGAVKAITEVRPLESPRRWEEAKWSGDPGSRTVWVIIPTTNNLRQATQIALRGSRPALRYYIPDRVAINGTPQAAVGYPLSFIRFHEGREALWTKRLSKSVGLAEGIATVVGINDNESLADWVYIVVENPPEPTTFKVVVGWDRRRGADHSNFEGRDP